VGTYSFDRNCDRFYRTVRIVTEMINLIGQRFGRLLCLTTETSNREGRLWICRCDCGTIVEVNRNRLKDNHTQSCGCYRKEYCGIRSKKNNLKHGQAKNHHLPRTYQTWISMRQRCNNVKAGGYKRYGGRGIIICERWNDFRNFLADMGERPEGMTLDRYPNNDGNYEPSNCRWATPLEQTHNRSISKTK